MHSLAINGLGAAADVQISQGQLQQAEQTCQDAIQIAGGKQLPPLGLAESILGSIALERNDIAAAGEFLQNGIALSRRGGLIDDVILGQASLSRLQAYQGHVSNAFETIQEANTIIQGFGVERMSILAAAHIANLQLFIGHEEAAEKWAVGYQAVRDTTARIRGIDPRARLLKTGDHEDVPSILDALLKRGQAQGRFRTVMEVRILMALYHPPKKTSQPP